MANQTEVKKLLVRKQLGYKLVEINKADVDKAEVVKTLILRTNGDFIAIALRGDKKIDFKKVKDVFGNKCELAKPEEVLKTIGVPVGAVCPIGLEVKLFLDKSVFGVERVHMGSGDLNSSLEMEKQDFLKAIEGYGLVDCSVSI